MKVQEKILQSADQVEMAALVRDSPTPLSLGLHDERVEGILDDEDAGQARGVATRGRALDDAQGQIAEELDRRSALLGAHYPFKRAGNALEYVGSKYHFYEFLLATAVVGEYSRGRLKVIPRLFELASAFSAQAYLGCNAGSYRTGWPRPRGEPKRLKGVIEKLRQLTGNHMGEWSWGPKEGKPDDPPPAIAKEQGLDLVAWKTSPDGRTGQLYLLGQCACGINWGTDAKLGDLNIDKLREWLRELSLVDPVSSIFTPHHADDETLLHATRRMKGLVFDRSRMVLLSQAQPLALQVQTNVSTLRRMTRMCASLVPI